MTSNFANAMKQTTTWNGAKSLHTADITGKTSGRLSLFFKAVRGISSPQLYDYLREADKEDLIDTFILCLHLRDCRGGKGERSLGKNAITWLFLNYPEYFEKILHLLPFYGRWDDLIELWPNFLNLSKTHIAYTCKNFESPIPENDKWIFLQKVQTDIVSLMAKQLMQDKINMNMGNPISICAKWAPTENDQLDKRYLVVFQLCNSLGQINYKRYRKDYISPLRAYLKIVENFMCKNAWDEIEFSKVPSCAMKRLKNSFEKNAVEKFSVWKALLSQNIVEVKGKQLFPHELINELKNKRVNDTVLQAQWEVLEKEAKDLGVLKSAVFVVDVSGSMEMWGFEARAKFSFTPMDVAIALGILGSGATTGPFHNHVISFHTKPTFHVLNSHHNLWEKYSQICRLPCAGSTNIQKVFDLILEKAKSANLKQEDMPTKIIIVSDMQFNCAVPGQTNFETIDKKYKASGYKRPNIIFWNVNGVSTDFPVDVSNNGTAMISGFSTSILKSIMNKNEFSPYTIMRETIDDSRYGIIREALKTP